MKATEIADALKGTSGLVYLMFVGNETYPNKIQSPIVKAGLLKNKENVYANVKKLIEKGQFLRFLRIERKAGCPRVFTADLAPIFTSLNYLKIEFDKEKVIDALKNLGFLNDLFPKFTAKFIEIAQQRVDNLSWFDNLSNYFMFLATVLGARKVLSERGEVSLPPIPKEAPGLKEWAEKFSKLLPRLGRLNQKQLNILDKLLERYPDLHMEMLRLSLEVRLAPVGIRDLGDPATYLMASFFKVFLSEKLAEKGFM